MEMILYPFKNIKLNENTSIILDSSFLLSLVYDDDNKHSECIETLRKLLISQCNLFITSIISSEVLNQIMYKVFIMDVQFKINKNTPFNSKNNIRSIINSFNKYDRKAIKDKRLDKLLEIPYKKYFDNLSKNTLKKDLLTVYFNTAVNMHTQLEHTLKFKYLDMNKECIFYAKELMIKHLITVNDATILSVANNYNIDYILTLDSDFLYAETTNLKILKI